MKTALVILFFALPFQCFAQFSDGIYDVIGYRISRNNNTMETVKSVAYEKDEAFLIKNKNQFILNIDKSPVFFLVAYDSTIVRNNYIYNVNEANTDLHKKGSVIIQLLIDDLTGIQVGYKFTYATDSLFRIYGIAKKDVN